MIKKNKNIAKLCSLFCIVLAGSQQIILTMGTPPNPKKDPPEQITEQTETQICTPENSEDIKTENNTQEQTTIISPETQTIATPEIKSQDTPQTDGSQISQEAHISQDSKNIPEYPTIVTLTNIKPVDPEIQIRSDIKEQLRWLHASDLAKTLPNRPEFSKKTEHYALIKLNPDQTEAQIDTQTNTPNFIYIDPSRPDNALNNGLFFWEKDEQIIETAWGELYLLRTHPESIYTCAFKTEEASDTPDDTEAQAPENNKSRDDEINNNCYCLFREKESLWGWEETLKAAQQKYPDFNAEFKKSATPPPATNIANPASLPATTTQPGEIPE